MRRRITPRHLVKSVLRAGDIDASKASGDDRLRILESEWRQQLALVDGRAREAASALHETLRNLAERRDKRLASREERASKRAAKRENLGEWRSRGVLDRMVLLDPSPPLRWSILIFLAGLDYYVFARAAAVAFDVEESPTSAEFWVGGLFGVLVFMLGLFLANTWKRGSLARAQVSIAREATDKTKLPQRMSPNFGVLMVTLFFFLLFCLIGAFVRIEAESGERISVLALQILVPVLVVLVEYLMHDPTDVRLPRRQLLDWWIDRRISQTNKALAAVDAAKERDRTHIDDIFNIAYENLRIELLDRGFSVPGRRSETPATDDETSSIAGTR
jgi:hypothetical protein